MENILEKKSQIKELLKIHWGYDDFRPGQEKVIDNVLSGRSTVVVMPTGGGKSLCYQLPALVLDGVTIVVSPLIALMKDQVDSLQKIGIPATFVNSSLSQQETYSRLAEVQAGQYKLLYIAPERFYNQEFLAMFKLLKVSLFAIDEAHCISQWGHDFRPSYLRLKDSVRLAGNPVVLALTATATPEVRQDIVRQLDLADPSLVITGFSRPNLQFGAIEAKEHEKPGLIRDAISALPDESGIVYAGTRARVDEITQYLLDNGIEAVAYHAGLEAEDRKWVQEQFISNKTKVIVATNAFGLGIDKPNIRFVIHCDMPGSVEAYYQEAGRAGRDRKDSFCLLLFNSRDRILHEFFIKGDNPPLSLIREIYDLLLSYEADTILVTYAELGKNLSEAAPDMAIGTALKILEKTGAILRSREKTGQAFLRAVVADFNRWREVLGGRAKKSLEIVDKLQARFERELKAGWEINLEEAAEIIGVKREALQRAVKKFDSEGLLEYRPPFKGTEIRILKREEFSDLEIDKDSLKDKLSQAYGKLERIEDYVSASLCRQKFILDYFGESDAPDCGKCDVCVRRGRIARGPKKSFLPEMDEL